MGFRVFRFFRLLRVIRVLKQFKELVLLCDAMAKSMRTLFWVFMMLVLALYFYSILCVELIGHDKSYPDFIDDVDSIEDFALEGFNNYQYFGTVARSFVTLLSLLTLSEWSLVSRPLVEHQPFALFVITMFVFLAVFGFMNVVIGVLVERALEAAQKFTQQGREAEIAKRMVMISEFQEMMNEIDSDGSGTLSKNEFLEAMDNSPALKNILSKLDFPAGFTIEEIFTLIDSSGDGSISGQEFKNGMSRMTECTPFQMLCILLTSINSLKSKIHQHSTEPRKASDASDWIDEGVFSPDGLKKDIAIMQRELHDMKVDFNSKLSNLLLLTTPAETPLQTVDKIPVWVPLPTAGEQSIGLSGGRCILLGSSTAEVEDTVTQPWTGSAPNTRGRCAEDCRTNCPAHDTIPVSLNL